MFYVLHDMKFMSLERRKLDLFFFLLLIEYSFLGCSNMYEIPKCLLLL
jgi:hypothetical protein